MDVIEAPSLEATLEQALADHRAGRVREAEVAYRAALARRPDSAEIANNLGCLLRERHDIAGAIRLFRRARASAPDAPDIACNLADALAVQGEHAESRALLLQALVLNPGSADIHVRLGRLLLSRGWLAAAKESYQAALRLRPDHAPSLNDLGIVLQAQGHGPAASRCFRAALRADPDLADAHYNFGCLLQLDNQVDAARACHQRALAADPLHGPALWARCFVELPILYATADQIAVQRARYTAQMRELAARAEEPGVARALAASVGTSRPFFLPCQGGDDRALQSLHGGIVARLMGRDPPALPPPSPPGARIRLGIVSGFFCEHTIWRLMLKGWLSRIDRARFELRAYHTGAAEDAQTALARCLCPEFRRAAAGDIRAAIVADRPDVLLYPEIGIDQGAARLAGERLARVQCVAWGQPHTSGLPTIDLFLSGALMEPAGAASHYSERLVTLPNLGIHTTPDERQAETVTRAALGLRGSGTLFWCGQALWKYLPQHDDVFARIAAGVPGCQFLFIGFAPSRAVTEQLRERLRRAFAVRGLDGDSHCVFVPPMTQERFLGTIRLADIMLDSIGWSGGKSTLDALAEAPAIVTLPSDQMRGRHTAAILTRIGVTETIAATTDAYVDIAVRLARDPAALASVRARMAAGRHRVMADDAPIRALERCLSKAVARNAAELPA